jgi:hypothetical protein
LPEVDVDFFVANGRSSQLICPPDRVSVP